MEIFLKIIEAIKPLGIPSLVAIILGAIGKRYLDKKLEFEKAGYQTKFRSIESQIDQSLEVHKQKIKNSEFFFKMQYQASCDLYKIKSEMMPPYRFPDMDWGDALGEIATDLGGISAKIKSYLNDYYTVLPPDVFEKLESAFHNAEEGSLYGDEGPGIQCADFAYEKIKECTSLLKAAVDNQRLVEFHNFKSKNA